MDMVSTLPALSAENPPVTDGYRNEGSVVLRFGNEDVHIFENVCLINRPETLVNVQIVIMTHFPQSG